jgi:pimeloyl-ACP methyl ester carboxylesterase
MSHDITQRTLDLGDLEVALLESGPAEGPLVLCLHGFPDTPHTFRYLLPELAAAGFHAAAPWLRGYAPTSLAPDGRYPLARLIDDAVRCHDALGGGRPGALVGHDWGAAIAHGAAAYSPDRFERVVELAVPPPGVFAQALFDLDQLQRSFYIWFFQTALAEGVVAADGFAFLERLWRKWSPGYDPAADLEHVVASLRAPENLSAAIGYYRAMFDFSVPEGLEAQAGGALGASTQPTLYLHGRDDGCFGAEVLERPDAVTTLRGLLGPGSETAILEGVGHFLHLEAPEIVNPRVVAWLAG